MSLQDKIDEANEALRVVAQSAKAPAIMCSFGKDSMVLLDLASKHGIRTILWLDDLDEILDPDLQQDAILRYGLKVAVLSKGRGTFMVIKDQPLFLSLVFVTDHATICIPTNLIEWTEKTAPMPDMCVDDELGASRGVPQRQVPVDHILTGSKLSEITSKGCMLFVNMLMEEQLAAHIAKVAERGIHSELVPGLPLTQPLLNWTDAEVWEYTEKYDVMWSEKVYVPVTHARQPTNKTWCFRCHDPRQPTLVDCPKSQTKIINFAAIMQDTDLRLEGLRRAGIMTQEQFEELR